MAARTKYQIFISSTYEDLKDERQEIVLACLEMGHIPIGMEMFSAANSAQWQVIKRTIDECDYYVLLLADRYGSTIPEEDGISYTEKEYDYAVRIGVPVLAFVLDRSASWPGDRREIDPAKVARLGKFKAKVQSRLVSFWKNQEELRGRFAIALTKAFADSPRPGWVPASEVASAHVSEEIARLSQENEKLRQLANEQRTNIYGDPPELQGLIDRLRSIQSVTMESQSLATFFDWFGAYIFSKERDLSEITNEVHLFDERYNFSGADTEKLIAFGLVDIHTNARGEIVYSLTSLGKQAVRKLKRDLYISPTGEWVGLDEPVPTFPSPAPSPSPPRQSHTPSPPSS
ncbi:MAG: hypothetical protein GIKADHBN_01451 [Phycisphaerales bacterium]|nr:hypothetical protein [Phycisphaerales bacterium]